MPAEAADAARVLQFNFDVDDKFIACSFEWAFLCGVPFCGAKCTGNNVNLFTEKKDLANYFKQ